MIIITMDNLFDIIEFVPTSPMILPETPEKLLGVINKSGLYMYSTEE
jgi:hypothetical protein